MADKPFVKADIQGTALTETHCTECGGRIPDGAEVFVILDPPYTPGPDVLDRSCYIDED